MSETRSITHPSATRMIEIGHLRAGLVLCQDGVGSRGEAIQAEPPGGTDPECNQAAAIPRFVDICDAAANAVFLQRVGDITKALAK